MLDFQTCLTSIARTSYPSPNLLKDLRFFLFLGGRGDGAQELGSIISKNKSFAGLNLHKPETLQLELLHHSLT